ncbi:HAD family hydrolase [Rhodococcus aerolatus]
MVGTPVPAVGFDLDMTLVDSATGIVDTQHAVLAGRGVVLDRAQLEAEVGVPVELLLARWLPAGDVDVAVAEYRARYAERGLADVTAMRGAAGALADLRRRGTRSVVVSAKPTEVVHLVLDRVGLLVDVAVGGLFAEGKAAALREHGVGVYVGDHPGDVAGALAAGARALAVATGSSDAGTLRAAGAEHVLADLTELPGWLDRARLPDPAAEP